MPAKELMNWVSSVKRWRVMKNKKTYWFNPANDGLPKTKEGSREGANAYWTEESKKLDQAKAVNWNKRKYLDQYDANIDEIDKIVPSKSAAVKKDESLQFYIDRFVLPKRRQAEAGGLSVDRVDTIINHLNKFATWFGKDRSIKEIKLSVIEDYYHWLLEQVAAKKTYNKTQKENKGISEHYANDLMRTIKSFVRDLDESDIITAPKKINNKTAFPIRKPKTTNKNVPISDIKIILKSPDIDDRMKLFVLLGLNCGMYQSDISDLLQSEVDWEEGRITRIRSKTQGYSNAPQVCHKLWNTTMTLLKKYRAKKGTLALLNEDGKPLRTMKFVKNGNKGTKSDCIKNAWFRAQKKLQMSYQFKLFRKTSANLLANNEVFQSLADLFYFFLSSVPIFVFL